MKVYFDEDEEDWMDEMPDHDVVSRGPTSWNEP